MKVYIIYLTLNLMLSHVVLINMIACNFESTSSFILDFVEHEPLIHNFKYPPKELF